METNLNGYNECSQKNNQKSQSMSPRHLPRNHNPSRLMLHQKRQFQHRRSQLTTQSKSRHTTHPRNRPTLHQKSQLILHLESQLPLNQLRILLLRSQRTTHPRTNLSPIVHQSLKHMVLQSLPVNQSPSQLPGHHHQDPNITTGNHPKPHNILPKHQE